MTMIACTLNSGFPIIHADLLISGEEGSSEFYVPAFADNLMDLLPAERDLHPVALQQKVYIVTDRICFAFAGKVWYATKFLEDLRTRCAITQEITHSEIYEFLSEYARELDSDEFSFFLIYMNRVEGGFEAIPYVVGKWVEKEIPLFGKMYLLGTGANDFIAAAEYVDQTRSSVPTTPSEAVQSNMALVSMILAKERIDPTTFLNHWGAGIETVWFDGNRFTNLEQVTFVFNHWDLNAQNAFGYPTPTKFTNYFYTSDSLFILDIEAKKGRTKVSGETIFVECDHDNLEIRFFVVQSIESREDASGEDYKDKRSFESTSVGMCYIIARGPQIFTPGEFRGRRDAKIEFQYGNGLKIEIARHLYENVASIIKEMNL
jgi:hypothetical protein